MTAHEYRSISGPVLVLLSLTLISILIVGNALVLDTVMGSFRPAWAITAAIFEFLLIGLVFFLRRDLRPAVRWNPLEMVGMVVVGVVFLVHAAHLAPSDLMPVSFSVDCPHQHLLVNYIYQNDRFPDNVDYLYIYNDYPVAPSALAAFSARLLGLLPVQTMYPLVALLVASQAMLVCGISIELLPRRPISHVLATLASLAVFLPYQYSMHAFTASFFTNMIMGDSIVLLTLWIVTVREKLHPLFSMVVAMGLVFGCLNSYPAWLPFVIIPMLASLLLDRRMSMRHRLLMSCILGGVSAVLTIAAVIDQWDFITWFAPVRDRRLLPSWHSLGGVFLLLVGWGLWIVIRNWKHVPGFALFLAIDFAMVIALYAVALLDKLALYIPDKTFYFNIYVFAVLAALSLNWLWERLSAARPGKVLTAVAATLVLGLVVLAFVNWRVPSPGAYPITLDEYRVAYQVAQETPDAKLTFLVRSAPTFYWVYGSVLNHTHDLEAQSKRWQTQPPTYGDWIEDPAAPQRAMVSDLASLPQDGRWREIIRAGDSGVIEKIR